MNILRYNQHILNENKIIKTIKVKGKVFFYDSDTRIYYDFLKGSEFIGGCVIDILPKKSEFNDKKDDINYSNNLENFTLKKSNLPTLENYVLYLSDLEIEEEHRGKGYGKCCLIKIIDELKKDMSNSKGLYLKVLKDNKIAIKMYDSLGFKILSKDGNILTMKLKL